MKVNEIFLSIQGESFTTGFPTIFVRFSGCNLRCLYCDTRYAYYEGVDMAPETVFERIKKLYYQRACLTGGEPLLQADINCLLDLLSDYNVTIETNGSIDLDIVKKSEKHSFVMDIKTPSSGCSDAMKLSNLKKLDKKDEIKFVIAERRDFDWAEIIINKYYKNGIITFSPSYNRISYKRLVKWILNARLDVRFQVQLHKLIWGPDKKGV